ncbi:hypothetical protein B566_EDAN009884 [Ephemera danica]|nr:hypothetical protein B566_EDAN009884 [Ephemera danica]
MRMLESPARSKPQHPSTRTHHGPARHLPIRDWLTVEETMLRQQSASVGDVNDVLQLLDKQKVRFFL